MTLDPHFQAMFDEQARNAPATPPLTQLPPDMVRAGYRAQRTSQNVRTAPGGVETRDISVGGAVGPIPARLYAPAEAASPSGLLVYFHGGGFVIGDLETHDAHCRRLAHHSGQRVMAVDYRLAPEHPFPAGHDDALALRLTLLGAQIRPDLPLWVSLFDRTIVHQLHEIAPSVNVLPTAEMVARELADQCEQLGARHSSSGTGVRVVDDAMSVQIRERRVSARRRRNQASFSAYFSEEIE